MDNILRYYLAPMSNIYCAKKSTANSVITIFGVGFDIIMRHIDVAVLI